MIYLAEGDMEGVAFSAIAFIPVIGQVSTPAKYLDDGAELVFKYGDDAAEAVWHSDDAFRFTMGYSDDPLGLLFKESEANGNLLHYGDDFLSGGVGDTFKGVSIDGTGPYSEVGGHHIHAKAAFKGDINYDPNNGFSISQDFMKNNGLNHSDMTTKQRQLFKELYESGRPNTLEEHTRIASEVLKAGGVRESLSEELIRNSLSNLKKQGVTNPSRIPWYSK